MSPSMESSIQIERRAAAWLTKRDGEDWTAEDERALAQWIDASTAHEIAFIRLEAMWQTASRLRALGAGVVPETVPAAGALRLSPFFDEGADAAPPKSHDFKSGDALITSAHGTLCAASRWQRVFAIAASLVIGIAAGSFWYSQRSGSTYETVVGGIESVPIRDGSRVVLNTDSAIRIALSEKEREVELNRGEAFFEVAKDPQRPFVVKVGNKRVVAVGTQFSVRRNDDGGVRVMVTEGKVRVEEVPSALFSSEKVEGPTVETGEAGSTYAKQILVTAGEVVRTDDSSVLVQAWSLPQLAESLSWRSGFLVFRQTPLGDAAAEFNRYNDRKMIIHDPDVASLPISGRFRTTNVDAFVRLVQGGFPVRAQQTANGLLLANARDSSLLKQH